MSIKKRCAGSKTFQHDLSLFACCSDVCRASILTISPRAFPSINFGASDSTLLHVINFVNTLFNARGRLWKSHSTINKHKTTQCQLSIHVWWLSDVRNINKLILAGSLLISFPLCSQYLTEHWKVYKANKCTVDQLSKQTTYLVNEDGRPCKCSNKTPSASVFSSLKAFRIWRSRVKILASHCGPDWAGDWGGEGLFLGS